MLKRKIEPHPLKFCIYTSSSKNVGGADNSAPSPTGNATKG